MTFWLAPGPAFLPVFTLDMANYSALAGALDALRRLGQQGALGEAGFTFWDHIKFIARQRRYPWDAPDAAAALRPAALGVPPWQGSGAHYAASRARGHATRELVLAALQPWAKVAVFDTDTHGPELASGLFMGVPSNLNLASTYWRKRGPVPGPPDSPDRDGCGVLFICPVLPLQGTPAVQALAQVEALIRRHGLEPNLGMHIDAHRTLLVYIALMYDREAPGEDARALACHDAVLELLITLGHYPVRLALSAHGRLQAPADDSVAIVLALKAALDPARVLPHGRYEFGPVQNSPHDDTHPTQSHD